MSQEMTPVAKRKSTINRFCLLALAFLVLLGCDRADFRNGFAPGEVATIDNAKVYHLADGVFIAQTKDGSNIYFLIESTVADYELTAEGLDIKLDDEKATRCSITPAPGGLRGGMAHGNPRRRSGGYTVQVDDTRLAGLLQNLTATTTARDIYNLKQ